VFSRVAVISHEQLGRALRTSRAHAAWVGWDCVAEGRDQLGLIAAVERGMERATQS
jgi:hypothetical protein